MSDGITLDLTEFRDTMREYAKQTTRDIPTILNTKGFYISRGAVRETQRVLGSTIKTQLAELLAPNKSLGKFFEESHPEIANKYKSAVVNRNGKDVPLVALLINAKKGKSGQKGLQGQDMENASKYFIANRVKSAAFIASGFLPSVKAFEPLAEKKGQAPLRDSTVKDLGHRKLGYAVTARPESWSAFAVIASTAASLDDGGKALGIYGTAGLQLAVNNEIRSMKSYIEDKMNGTAKRFNAK